jgi:hypothetical protein
VAAVEVFFEKSKKSERGCGSRGRRGENCGGRHCPSEERPLVRYLYSPPSKCQDCGDTTELEFLVMNSFWLTQNQRILTFCT